VFSLVSSINKTDRHDITETFLKVTLKLHNPNPKLSKDVSEGGGGYLLNCILLQELNLL
jgi:hypothetical protein